MEDETTETTKTTNEEKTEEVKPFSLYEKTEAVVARQEEANKKTEELLQRQETLHANQRLAGTTGGHVEVKPKEETPKEYAQRISRNELKENERA